MKKFLISIFLFLLPVTFVFFLIEYKLAHIPNSYNKKKVLLEKNLADIEILNLGASHALYGINPAYFSHNGFNLANVSQTIFYDRRLTELYVDKMPKLKLVLIPISNFTLYSQLHDGNEEWRDYFYYHFWKIKYRDLPLFDSKRYFYTALYSIEQTRDFIRSGFKPTDIIDYTPTGYAKNDTTGHLLRINDSLGSIRAQYHIKGTLNKQQENKYIISDLTALVNYLKGRHINVVFVTTPVYHTYSDHINKQLLASNAKVIDSLCNRFGCSYFNYFSDNRFTINDFADNDHLGTQGASKFSSILDNEIIKPILK